MLRPSVIRGDCQKRKRNMIVTYVARPKLAIFTLGAQLKTCSETNDIFFRIHDVASRFQRVEN